VFLEDLRVVNFRNLKNVQLKFLIKIYFMGRMLRERLISWRVFIFSLQESPLEHHMKRN